MNVFSVLSPSISAATTSPGLGVIPCSTITVSPGRMCLPIMESPRTSSANVRAVGLIPTVSMSTEMQPTASCWRSSANPAGMVPNRGMSTIRLRRDCKGEMTRKERALPGSFVSALFRPSNRTCCAAAVLLLNPKCAAISRSVGTMPRRCCVACMKSSTRRCALVSSTIYCPEGQYLGFGRCQLLLSLCWSCRREKRLIRLHYSNGSFKILVYGM